MYQDPNMLASIRKVEAAREENIKLDPRRMTADEKDALLKKFHPDYRTEQFTELRFGPNKGQKVPLELADLLEGESRVLHEQFDLTKPDYETDVLIIGGGGAGCSAAIEADKAGAKVMVVTKLRMGDANTMMAEGGIQAADKPNDSPAQHFLDAYGGGHFAAQKDLLYKLVMDAPEAIQWLSGLGVEFDKAPDGTMITTHGGGTSRKRMHAAKDYSGAEIMRTLRDEVLNRGIPVVDFTSAIELIKDENGHCAGAILLNMETKELLVAKAKTVILATGGAGRLHYQGFPTSNHYGATADGLVLGYRAGAKLLYPDTLQYHPTGAAYPAQIYGALVTEKVRSVGAMLVNANGEVFMNPLETRDVAAVTGLLLALTLPPGFPLWMAAVASVFAIAVGKLFFGGLGFNIMNPALVGRAFAQASFTVPITTWTPAMVHVRFDEFIPSTLTFPFAQPPDIKPWIDAINVDGWTGATPLALMKFDHVSTSVAKLLLGTTAGSIGETSALLILVCGLFLAFRGMMNWRIVASTLGSAFLLSAAFHLANPEVHPGPLFTLFSGGLMLGAVFMATDMVTAPVTPLGIWVYGTLIGVLTVIIRLFGGLNEGMMYAILLANAAAPLINMMTQPRIYGAPKREKKVKA